MSPSRAPQLVSLEIARRSLERAGALAEWGMTAEQFQNVLERSAARRFSGSTPDPKTVNSYVEGLQLKDLALSCACAAGSEGAWEFFVREFRPELYRAARAIAGEANSRELADSLYGELYGLRDAAGARKSLFDYFHGRSRLSTWLRAILAQRHVDEIRRARRTEPLEDESGEESAEVTRTAKPANVLGDAERQRYLAMLQVTLTAALDALESRERLRLAYYYVEELTLAQIGKLMGEHEATVSRKLDRTRRDLRQRIEEALREKKLSEAQLQLCYEYAREEWPFDLTLSLRSGQSRALSARD